MRGAITAPHGGIIRTASRPGGWQAPGPPPAPEHIWAPHLPRAREDLCFLTGNWRILQRLDGHRYSLDDLTTAWVAGKVARTPQRTLDLGCGIGSVLMMVAWQFPDAVATGIEAQEVSVGLARRSIAINGITERCVVRHGDLRTADATDRGPFDLITGTPPYIPLGDGVVSEAVQKGPCRHEFRGGVEDYCEAAARHLAPGGRFVVCQAAADTERVAAGADRAGLSILARLDVFGRQQRPALFSVFTMGLPGAGRAPADCVLTELIVRDIHGRRTAACLQLREDMGFPPVSSGGTSAPG